MELTTAMLIGMHACPHGLDWFVRQNETDVGKLIQLAIDNLDDDVFGFANWGIARLLDKTNKIRYAVFAAELVLPIFEEKYPDDDRPRKAIEAAKAVIIEENRLDVAAADAAYAAARAAACAVAYATRAASAAACAAGNKEVQKKILEYGKSLLIGNK